MSFCYSRCAFVAITEGLREECECSKRQHEKQFDKDLDVVL